MNRMVLIGGAGAALLAMAAGALAMRPSPVVRRLIGDDYGRVRREALALFPRGMPVSAVSAQLTAMGFVCAPMRHLIANINAPSVECDSAGRGYPDTAHMELTVMARNGSLSDIAIGNGMAGFEANASDPDPKSAFPEPIAPNKPASKEKEKAEHKAEK